MTYGTDATPGDGEPRVPQSGRDRRGRGRRRTAATLGVVAVAAIGAVVAVVVRGSGDAPMTTASPSASGGSSPTAAPSVTSGSVSGDPGVAASAFDDGIDEASLPALAPQPSADYPVAYVLEDWVWDHVDERWGLALYMSVHGLPDNRRPVELYLVSPEGVHFEVMEVSPGVTYGAHIAAADLESRTAVITLSDEAESWRERVDLASGSLVERYDERAEGVAQTFTWVIGPYVDGKELRGTDHYDNEENSSGYSLTLWDRAGGERTLTPSTNGVALPAGGLGLPTGDPSYPPSDPRYQPLVHRDYREWSGSGPEATVFVADVVDEVIRPVTVLYPTGHDRCSEPRFSFEGWSVIWCEDGSYGDPGYSRTAYRVSFDGTTPAVPTDPADDPVGNLQWTRAGFAIDFGPDNVAVALTDVAGQSPVDVWTTSGPQDHGVERPVEVGDGAYIVIAPMEVLGYDRATGTVTRISADVPIVDDASSLRSYVSFARPYDPWAEREPSS